MNGEHTSRPTAGAIMDEMESEPPLVGFDGNDVENFFTRLRGDVDWGNFLIGKKFRPCFFDRGDNGCIGIGNAWFITIPTWHSWIAMPDV